MSVTKRERPETEIRRGVGDGAQDELDGVNGLVDHFIGEIIGSIMTVTTPTTRVRCWRASMAAFLLVFRLRYRLHHEVYTHTHTHRRVLCLNGTPLFVDIHIGEECRAEYVEAGGTLCAILVSARGALCEAIKSVSKATYPSNRRC